MLAIWGIWGVKPPFVKLFQGAMYLLNLFLYLQYYFSFF